MNLLNFQKTPEGSRLFLTHVEFISFLFSCSLFGDIDLRAKDLVEKKPRKEKADFEAVRAKLNATKEKAEKLRPGIKILDEFPQMPPSENGTSDLMRKVLGRKERGKESAKDREVSPPSKSEVVEAPVVPQPQKQSRFSPLEKEEKNDEITDLGNLTAADLRKSTEGKSTNPSFLCPH
jgi:hypothetical protein